MEIQLNTDNLNGFVSEEDFNNLLPQITQAHEQLNNKTGKGNAYTGWLDLPSQIPDSFLDEIEALGREVRSQSDCVVSIGIGGSYIGIRATLEFLIAEQKLPFYYAGNNLSSGYLYHLMHALHDKRITMIVISKSGTTTEPALAFRIIRRFMLDKYGPEETRKRIICITDAEKGALRSIVNKEGYRSYAIREDVGGRFSILTAAGLVPLAMAGVDVRGLISGARLAQKNFSQLDLQQNISYRYAAARYLLYKKGKMIEVLSTFYQRLAFVDEWWKQLFGESEGKDGKGLFPTALHFTADLHSMGQYLQEGDRNMFETFLIAENSGHEVMIPWDDDDLEDLNCTAGKDLDFVNKQAYKATAMAHFEGGVPNMTIIIPRFDASTLGQLFYFFEKAVAITGYLLDVNPFNQPGVEAYKKKMYALLGRAI